MGRACRALSLCVAALVGSHLPRTLKCQHGGKPRMRKGYREASHRRSRFTARPKGQIRYGKKVQYAIKSPRGSAKYFGTTNNPSRRASEHRASGKMGRGDRLVVQTRAISSKSAERVERSKLFSFRKRHGHNPKHNVSKDGKWRGGWIGRLLGRA